MKHDQTSAEYEQDLIQLLRLYNPGKAVISRLQKHPIDRQVAILQLARSVQIALEAAKQRAGVKQQIH